MALPAAQAQPASAPRQAETVRFDIFEFAISGNTVLPQLAIERAVYPFLGPDKGVADVESARKALEKAYQNAGFLSVTVDIPPQRVGQSGGEVKLTVVEAPVARLRVTGAQWFLPSEIKAQVPSLAEGSVPNFNDMQAELGALARQTNDREITPLLAAGDQPGTMNVELKVQDRPPLNGFVELNSKQAENTERGRLEASLSYDNLFQRQHSFGLYWFYSPRSPEQANILSANYGLPLGGPGDRLSFSFTTSDSNTPTPLGGGTVSNGTTFGTRWTDQLADVANLRHSLSWGATYRDLQDSNEDVAGFQTSNEPLRYPVFSIGYDLSRVDDTPGRFSTVSAGLNFGLKALGDRKVGCDGRNVDQFECQRAGAKPDFQTVTLGGSHREPIGKGWTVYGRLQAQIASGPLVPAEQITLGGVDTVRGYYDGEQAGDWGVASRFELGSPPLIDVTGIGLTALAFLDRAVVGKKDSLPGEISRVQLGSVGLGARMEAPYGLQVRLDWAHVIFDTEKVGSNGTRQPVTGDGADGQNRWELSVRHTF